MLVDLKRMVAYICPFCSNISSKNISVFNFSSVDEVKLICPTHGCREKCVSIIPKKDRYNVEIECPLCGDKHSYSTPRERFWNKRLITYKCAVAGIDIFFAGERAEVEKVLDENSDVYSDIIDEFDEMFDDGYDNDSSFDVIYLIIERLRKLQENHRIGCACGSDNVLFDVINGNVVLTCGRCRRTKTMETSEDTLTKLMSAHRVVIGG